MLESSSRLAPSNQAMPMASSTVHQAWCSIIEVSCSSQIPAIIECKYSRVMTGLRSCPSSACKATGQASSWILSTWGSITIMIASSSLITAIIEYNRGLWATNRSYRPSAIVDQEISSSAVLKASPSTTIIVASSSSIPTTIDWCSCRRSISRSCSRSAASKDLNLENS